MNGRFLFVLSACLAVSLASPAEAGWGPGGCTVVQAAPVASDALRWEYHPEHGQSWLFRGQHQIAAWDHEAKVYRARIGNGWSEPQPAPWAEPSPCADGCGCERCEDGCKCGRGNPCGDGCPCITAKLKAKLKAAKEKAAAEKAAKRASIATAIQFLDAQFVAGDIGEEEYIRKLDPLWVEMTGQPHGPLKPVGQIGEDGIPNYGIDLEKMNGGERATINGRAVSKKQLLEAIGAPAIPDDANLLRLTIVAEDKAAMEKVRASVTPLLAPITDKVVVQWYTKDNWAIRPQYGFAFDKLPAVLLEAPEKPGERGGEALFQDVIAANPAPVFAAVRSKVDSFDPKKVPNSNSGQKIPPIYGVGALGVLILGYILLKR